MSKRPAAEPVAYMVTYEQWSESKERWISHRALKETEEWAISAANLLNMYGDTRNVSPPIPLYTHPGKEIAS